MRYELIGYLEDLSNTDEQKQTWPPNSIGHHKLKYDPFDLIIHHFFDDTSLADNPESMIGVTIYNQEEITILKPLINLLDNLLNQYKFTYAHEYLVTKEWSNIAKEAKKVLIILNDNNENFSFVELLNSND